MPHRDVTTLIWAHRTERPDPGSWLTSEDQDARSALRWASLHQAINYAIGMQRDRAATGLHPWIRTPAGHIYSPVIVEVMAEAMVCQSVRDMQPKTLAA